MIGSIGKIVLVGVSNSSPITGVNLMCRTYYAVTFLKRFAYGYVYSSYEYSALGGWKRTLEPLELELQIVVNDFAL